MLLWWRSFAALTPAVMALWFVLAAAVWNGGALLEGIVGALRWAKGRVTSVSAWVMRTWEHPPAIAEGVRALLLLILIISVVRVVRALTFSFPETAPARQERQRRERLFAERGGFLPVVVLLVTATRCGDAYQRWSQGTGVAGVPRVSMRSAERVVWQAYRTRYAAGQRVSLGSHHRRVLKEHAAQVVGALRAAEARQDADPARALQDMAVMLVTIAERYAEGRLGQLLDEDRLNPEISTAPGEMFRLLALGVAIVGAMSGAVVLGLPSDVLGPLLGFVATLGAVLFLRGRVPTSADLVDIFRGADRR
ncbi:hypothetical protein AB0G83_06000 [Streptomyces klenkii]|uniref:hypothetical protein n=1 Tax=Streptomyces klenkii TaxID=1420899 RepID=UPI003409717C